ncbi:unnamed protein product [Auanema sp. JU1783]|nr:unnamed protein product [Auanema sp. JU1783]
MEEDETKILLWLSPTETSTATLGLFSIFFLFSTVLTIGLVLNLFVFYRMTKLAKRDPSQFFNGTGIFLLVMSISDLSSLLTIYFQLILIFIKSQLPLMAQIIICKTTEYLTHIAFTQSMYCWLCMSGLRYLAAMHPLQYSTVWRNPLIAIIATLIIAVILNLQLLTTIGSESEEGCSANPNMTFVIYDLVDAIISYAIPFWLIVWMDLRVLCGCKRRKTSDPLLQVVFHKVDEDTEKSRKKNMRRFMIVTLISLALAFPEVCLSTTRVLLEPNFQTSPVIFYGIKFLFYVRFSFNSFYLTAYVFDRNVLSKASSSRQLSLSIRRLEENPSIILRERSNTVSYRATTPVPVLTRNSSCIILDSLSDTKREWV